MTPRKLRALLRVHMEVMEKRGGAETNNNKPQFGYIDQIPGW